MAELRLLLVGEVEQSGMVLHPRVPDQGRAGQGGRNLQDDFRFIEDGSQEEAHLALLGGRTSPSASLSS